MAKSKKISSVKKDGTLVLNMTFEEAMKKALTTPLPKKSKKNKKDASK